MSLQDDEVLRATIREEVKREILDKLSINISEGYTGYGGTRIKVTLWYGSDRISEDYYDPPRGG